MVWWNLMSCWTMTPRSLALSFRLSSVLLNVSVIGDGSGSSSSASSGGGGGFGWRGENMVYLVLLVLGTRLFL